jgi:serine O-acetyltransferase
MTVRPKVLRAPFSILYRMLFRRCRNVYGIELPYSAKIGRRVVFEHQHGIVIHGHCEIGDDCTIRQGCTLGNKTLDRPHDAPKLGNRVTSAPAPRSSAPSRSATARRSAPTPSSSRTSPPA